MSYAYKKQAMRPIKIHCLGTKISAICADKNHAKISIIKKR